jgi:glyoxylate reductase
VIDETALTQLLIAGEIAGAGLDVFENDPAVNPKLLWSTTTSIFCPTLERPIDTGDKVIVNIKTFTDGHKPLDGVLSDQF